MKCRLIILGSRTIHSSFPIYWSCLTSSTNPTVHSTSSTCGYMPWVSPLNPLIHSLLCNRSSFQAYLFLKTPVLKSLPYMPFASWSLSWSDKMGCFHLLNAIVMKGKDFGQIWIPNPAHLFSKFGNLSRHSNFWPCSSSCEDSNITALLCGVLVSSKCTQCFLQSKFLKNHYYDIFWYYNIVSQLFVY